MDHLAKFAQDCLRIAAQTPVDDTDPSMGFVSVRIGIDCGPVSATVVGTVNPHYTLLVRTRVFVHATYDIYN